MKAHNRLDELETQIGLVWDIIRHTDVNDPRMEQLRELLAEMTNKLIDLRPTQEPLNKTTLSEDSL